VSGNMQNSHSSCGAGIGGRRTARGIPLVVIAASALAGCFAPQGRHTMRFELVQEMPGAVVAETKSYFFWGLVPTVKVDVSKKCPYGAVAIVDGSDTGGLSMALPTLGLWSRRSTTYYCRQPPPDRPS
jgi:Bor protein